MFGLMLMNIIGKVIVKKYDEGEIREIFNDVCGSSGYDEILDDWFNIKRR